jgi:BirA family biotin operon repressor/biotin-[acetyl-CoA-carboxylase] ligase
MSGEAHALQIAFQNSRFVKHFYYYPSIGSTNDKARELAQRGAEEGTLVIADAQTAGRGRGDRTWHSPGGLGIHVSFIFRPGTPADSAFGVLMSVCLGTAGAVEAVQRQGVVSIKWPNDLFVEGKKLGGVLSEFGTSGGAVDWAVIGLGLNVNHSLKDFPVSLRDKASSLHMVCRRPVDRVTLLVDLIERSAAWYREYLDRGMTALVPEWRRRSAIIDRLVRVETAGETYVGTAVGIEETGALRIRLESGAEEVLHAGDVHLLQVR